MDAKIDNGSLVLTLPLNPDGVPSSTGKSMVHATTRGNIPTAAIVNGQPLVVSVNAYTKATGQPTGKAKAK